MATLRQTFSEIADAIRAKGVSGQTMKPIEMASKIGEIQTGGGIDYGYLTFTAQTSTTLNLKQDENIRPHKLLKSTDGQNWTKWENPATNGISLNVGESVYLKADEDALWRTSDDIDGNKFSSTGKIKCEGDIRSIVKLVAPANYSNWFNRLFSGCTFLTKAPELPATNLADSCYQEMFSFCYSLTTAPELPATTLTDNCYERMFISCIGLLLAPELPATTLAYNCYNDMFSGCESLKRIKMNASSGSWGPNMFDGCTSLELVDMTGSTGVPQLSNVNNFQHTNDTYKIVVPDSLYDTWIAATNWASIASHIMKKSDWNSAHPDDILGQ